MGNNRIYKTSALEDAMRDFCRHKPLVIGHDFARKPDRTVFLERSQNIGKTLALSLEYHDGLPYAFLKGRNPLYANDLNFTITQGDPMQETTTKQFVTKDVPGFEDGHPLRLLNRDAIPSVIGDRFEPTFFASRRTENGIEINANFPANPENTEKHVRVKAVKPEKKA